MWYLCIVPQGIGVRRAEQASSDSVLSPRSKSTDGYYHRMIITSADG